MTRAAALVSLLLALLCVSHGATRVHAFGHWVAPQNHRSVNGSCVAANLDAEDFCAAVVTYPVSSSLLRTRGAEGLLAPVEAARADHESILQRNDLGAVLSSRAAAEYSALLAHHDEAAVVAANLPGGVRHAARARAISRGASDSEAESAAAATPIPGQEQCEALLRRYSCQNQYARCEDRAQYRDALGRPTELHTCYALCHAVRSTCHLSHRLDCRAHHRRLDPLWEQPSEHALRFDPTHSGDPYSSFWRVDCTDSPPGPWKHLGLFLLHGGPARYLAYAAAGIIVYALVSALTGLGESPVVAGMRLRRERRARSAREESLLQRARNKHGKLLQLRAQLLNPRAQAQAQAQAQGPAGERALRIAQVDEAIARLEREVGVMMRGVQERRAKEDEEDLAAGRAPASSRTSSSSTASPDPRARAAALRRYLKQGGPEPEGLTLEEAEALLDPEEEEELLQREGEEDEGEEGGLFEWQQQQEGAEGSFGRRRQRLAPVQLAGASSFSPPAPQRRPVASSSASFNPDDVLRSLGDEGMTAQSSRRR